MRILIADDDDVSRKLLAHTLTKRGYDVTEAQGGEDAWSQLDRQHFPVLVSDWLMPDMDGLDLCRRLRATPRERYTYVILVTVRSGKDSYLAGIEAGADDFFVKPVDDDQLVARLHVAERVLALEADNHALAELLPICPHCLRSRTGSEYQRRLQEFVTRRDAPLGRGLCEPCLKEQFPSLWSRRQAGREPA